MTYEYIGECWNIFWNILSKKLILGMNTSLSKEEILSQLGPFLKEIVEVVENGHKSYLNDHFGLGVRLSSSTNTATIHDLVVHHAKSKWIENPKVAFFDKKKLSVMRIGQFCIIFKKVDRQLKPSWNMTTQVKSFLSQQSLFEGTEFSVNLVIGYQIDGSGIRAIYMIQFKDETFGKSWCEKLSGSDEGQISLDLEGTVTPPIQPKPNRVKSKLPSTEPKRNEQ